MGTRGLRVYRFRKRYYVFYNQWDSYPEGLGKQIVTDIPADSADYQVWLNLQRAMLANWEGMYLRFITVMPGNEINSPWDDDLDAETGEGTVNEDSTLSEGEAVEDEPAKDDDEQNKQPQSPSANGNNEPTEDGDPSYEPPEADDEPKERPKENPAWMRHMFPSLFVPLNDTYIEYIYILDLDEERFIVNNGAHYALEKMPHIDWMAALQRSSSDNHFVMPGIIPDEVVVDLVVRVDNHAANHNQLPQVGNDIVGKVPIRRLVTSKNVASIPWQERHGMILRTDYFLFWSSMMEDSFAATLLQLTPSDFLFREIAYAILCMAAGGRYVSIFPKRLISNNSAFGFVVGEEREITKSSEFYSVLGSGAHRHWEAPGSAPQDNVYWFEGVLVFLVAQLFREDAVDQSLTYATHYWEKHHPNTIIDAVLISIEHAVLAHFVPAIDLQGAEIQHTGLLPLVKIQEHLTMHAKDRCNAAYLSEVANPSEKFTKRQERKKREAMSARMLRNEGISFSWGKDEDEEVTDEDEQDDVLHPTQVDESICETFNGLQHLISAATRRHLAPNRQGRFPTEIYQRVLSFVTDAVTRDACLHASRVLQDICQQEYLFCEVDGSLLRPCEACEGCTHPEHIPKWWSKLDVHSGMLMDVTLKRGGCSFLDLDREDDYMVMIGSEYGRRSLLPEAAFRFKEYKD